MYNLMIHYYKINDYDKMTDIMNLMMDTDIKLSIKNYKKFYSVLTRHNEEYEDLI